MTQATSERTPQAVVGGIVILTGLGLAFGALRIPGEAGYGGVGPNFLPWVVAAVLTVCGVLILREALTGGFRDREEASGSERGWWPGLVWVSAGLLANAALITKIGFILSCMLCYLLAVQGLRRARGERIGGGTLVADLVTGAAIAAPIFWIFTKFLAINLPGLTRTGWI
ncbi:MAG TPA: tripartite tricarboxylate transporter TctB family protein [Ramlibacter sp.]|nr:tripartite tricarboxylate transporter TctB family protein [Ramlibacter sp.]